MPLVAWCALAYAAGLITGFALPERDALIAVALLAAASVAHAPAPSQLDRRRDRAVAAGGVLGGASPTRRTSGPAARRSPRVVSGRSWSSATVARGRRRTRLDLRARLPRVAPRVFVRVGPRRDPGALLALSGRAEAGERAILVREGRRSLRSERDAFLPRLRAGRGDAHRSHLRARMRPWSARSSSRT